MGVFIRSTLTAFCIAAAVQLFTVGVLAPRLPREVCRPVARDIRELVLGKARLLHVINRDGAITVSAYDGPEIRLSADVKAYPNSAFLPRPKAKEYLDSLFEVQSVAESVFLIAEPQERPEDLDLRIDYTVQVPKGTNFTWQGRDGNVKVGPGCGRVTVRGNNADIDVQAPQGLVFARCNNGRIAVVDSVAAMTLETVNGSIAAQLRGGSINATTTTGNIAVALLETGVEAVDLNIMNGDITLQVAPDCSAQVHATSGRGTVRSDLPLTGADAVRKRRELHGALGRAGTKVKLHSLNGNVLITGNAT